SGVYPVVFRASDGTLLDTEVVQITVNNVNLPPVLAVIGNRSTNENQNLNFNISANDPDGTTPTFSTSTLPSGATFNDNGNGTGTFNWTPSFNQAGTYNIVFRASDGPLVDTEIVQITVNNVNRDPVLAAIGNKLVNENQNLNFGVSASDPDGNIPVLTTSTLPSGATFMDNGNGTGTFNWTPDFTQSGVYNITFRASDGSLVDTEIVQITVTNVNLPPVLATIGNRSVNENSNLNFNISANDPDGTIPTFTSSTLPTGATLTNNGNGTATFNWTPNFTQSGVYNVTFRATDGALVDTEIVQITVNNVNQPPVLATIGNRNTTEGVNLNFNVSASDPDGPIPVLTTSVRPNGATFVDNGNGTGTFNWTPLFNQAGVYNVTFYATDAASEVDSEVVAITVTDGGNQVVTLNPIGNKSVNEGTLLSFIITATDPDSTFPSFTTSTLPTGATLVNNGNGSASFNWTPDFSQAGSYPVTFRATDGTSADTEIITINVLETGNQPPVLAAIGNKSITEGVNLNFIISATDPDGTTPGFTTTTLPTGATFINNGNGTGTFNWTPGFTQAGNYPVTFRATDGVAVDTEVITITVLEAGNQIPVLATIGPRGTTEGVNLTFGVSATDADGTTPTLTTSTRPSGANFTDNGNGTGTFNWTPNFTQSGTYFITFYASDGSSSDSEIVTISIVEQGNQPPVLAAIGNKSTTEGVNLNFGVSATDPDATIPILVTSTLPTGATFIDNGNGTGTFNWTPSFVQSGPYNIVFRATDGVAVDTEIVTITVNDAGNRPPDGRGAG
ncbi:MAG: putative Ig domain-containing protein, partial [Candidatus Zixiibacteriota bacterium]